MKRLKKSSSTIGCRTISMSLLRLNCDGTVKNDNAGKLSLCTLNYKWKRLQVHASCSTRFSSLQPGERQSSIQLEIITHQSDGATEWERRENYLRYNMWPNTAWIMSNLYMLDMSFSRVTCFPKSTVRLLIVTNVLGKEISFSYCCLRNGFDSKF